MLQKYVLFCASSFLQSKVCLDVCELSLRERVLVSLCLMMEDFSAHWDESSADERQVHTPHTCKYLPQHMWPGWSCSAHGTRGTCEWGQRKLDTGLQGPEMTKLRQAASRPSGCQRMTSSGCVRLRVSSFLCFKIKNGSLENSLRELASYLTSLKIIIQPSVVEQCSSE